MKRSLLKRKTPLKSGGKLRPISKKRAKQVKEYSKLRKEYLSVHTQCAVFPFLKATEIHHKNHRENDRLNDAIYFLPVSKEGHLWLHENPAEARKRGWLL